ncbi:MAG: sn-glycerol-3-phosphate ABC transporter ATP-binding protein UgpC [candidate division WOR-3 bacterium]|nr:MAG: sn-glycerol-3-phosphate ABC transporter ATP-binding protein UgpC [candidate division WOR-3 bacterium]
MPRLLLESVTKVYDRDVYAAKDISFAVEPEEFTVLVGPSGCGKTTTLRLIAGLEELTSGNIYIDGKCMNDVSPKDRDVAMVFQNYALYPHMSVYDNMAFGLRMRKYPKQKVNERVVETARTLGISSLLERKPRQLSGGQRQRVALGRSIVRNPKLFLFDEPLSNLDAKMRVQMRAELARLHKKIRATIIYVTHDQVEAMTLGQKIIVLKEGEVQQVADPMGLYKKPRNKFVAGFIGSPPMNFVSGSIVKRNRKIVFCSRDFTLELNKSSEKMVEHEVILGIRPTDFSVTRGSCLEIIVDVIEPMGTELYVHGRLGETMFSARVPEDAAPRVGNSFALKIDPARIYFFDEKTEQKIK